MHFEPYNAEAPEPKRRYFDDTRYLQVDEDAESDSDDNDALVEADEDPEEEGSDLEAVSDSSSSDDDEDDNDDQSLVQWRVIPDVAEQDDAIMTRERDIVEAGEGINEKFSGWHNPLADTDGGDDDEKVLTQLEDDNEEDKEEDVQIKDKVDQMSVELTNRPVADLGYGDEGVI